MLILNISTHGPCLATQVTRGLACVVKLCFSNGHDPELGIFYWKEICPCLLQDHTVYLTFELDRRLLKHIHWVNGCVNRETFDLYHLWAGLIGLSSWMSPFLIQPIIIVFILAFLHLPETFDICWQNESLKLCPSFTVKIW